jgi:hypothetical protein
MKVKLEFDEYFQICSFPYHHLLSLKHPKSEDNFDYDDLFDFSSLFGFRGVFDLLNPNLFVGEFAEEVKENGEHEADEEKDDAHGERQLFEDGVDPDVRLVLDDVNPSEIGCHEEGETDEACFSARILAERREHLHDDEDHDVRVHDVVQPAKIVSFSGDSSENQFKTHLGKNASNAFGKTNSRSMKNSDQKVTPTLKATGNAKVAKM